MSSNNERVLALIIREILAKSDVRDKIDNVQLIDYLNSLKQIINDADDSAGRKRSESDGYSYTGVECRQYARVERELGVGEQPTDDCIDVCNVKRLGTFGNVIQLCAFRGEECKLEIYYDYTLNDVLQPCVDPDSGKLLGFCRVDIDPLCGQSRLRNNLKMFADKGQDDWNRKHHYETDLAFAIPNPKYAFSGELWERLCDKFYNLHPRKTRDMIDTRSIEQQIEDLECARDNYIDSVSKEDVDRAVIDEYYRKINELYNKLSQAE